MLRFDIAVGMQADVQNEQHPHPVIPVSYFPLGEAGSVEGVHVGPEWLLVSKWAASTLISVI